MTLALSMLNLVSLFRVLGPLLITVVQMLSDSLRFAIVIGIVVVGYANGFYSLIHFGVRGHPPARNGHPPCSACSAHCAHALTGARHVCLHGTPACTPRLQVSEEYLAGLDYDYSYTSIVTAMCLWLTGQPDLSLVTPLSPGVQVGATVLFWTFIVTTYFVLLTLLIAIFNTTYERILSNSVAEWLFIRLKTTVEFEGDDASAAGVRAYYEQLQARDNQRGVRGVGVVDNDGDDGTEAAARLEEDAKTKRSGL